MLSGYKECTFEDIKIGDTILLLEVFPDRRMITADIKVAAKYKTDYGYPLFKSVNGQEDYITHKVESYKLYKRFDPINAGPMKGEIHGL